MRSKNTYGITDIISDIWTPVLIWTAAVIAFANNGDKFLAILLVICGVVWVYKNLYVQTKLKEVKNGRTKKHRN